jgi:hypothetical protein
MGWVNPPAVTSNSFALASDSFGLASNSFPTLMMKRLVVLSALAIAVAAHAASAQRSSQRSGPIELGIDGGVSFLFASPTVTSVSLPVQDFRLGYFLNDKAEIEPRLSINSVHANGGGVTTYGFEVGLLLSQHGDRVGNGLYLRPFAGVTGVSVTGGGSNNSGNAGAGVGVKLPFEDRRLATRMEANYTRQFGNGGMNEIGVLIGLSFFTR